MKRVLIILVLLSSFVLGQNRYNIYTPTNGTLHYKWLVGIGSDLSTADSTCTDDSVGLRIFDGGEAGSRTFVSGWQTGNGWKLAYKDSEYTLIVDNIDVRGTLSAYEYLISQIRASNGNLYIGSAAKVDSVNLAGNFFMTEDVTELGITPFAEGDIIVCQTSNIQGASWDGNGDMVDDDYLIKRLVYEVASVNGLKVYYTTLSGAPTNKGVPEVGDVFVRIGNTDLATYPTRGGSVGLYTDEPYAPYIRISDSVNSWGAWKSISNVKAQMGRLDGITDPDFGGALEGYGLYSTNVYLKGKIIVTNPEDFDVVLDWDSLTNKPLYFNAPSGSGLFLSGTNMGYYADGAWKTYMDNEGGFYLTGSGSNYLSWDGNELTIAGDGNALDISSNSTISGINGTLSTYGTSITQNANAILLKANSTTTDSLRGRISTAESEIEVNADNILAKVSRTTLTDSVVSFINLSPESITISSDKIDVFGVLNIWNSDTTMATRINGDRIQTGTIQANRLTVASLSAISADLGTITAGTVTGATIRTAASGQRVVIDGSNQVSFYDESGNSVGSISGNSSVGFSNLRLNASAVYADGDLVAGNNLDFEGYIKYFRGAGTAGQVLASDGTNGFSPTSGYATQSPSA